MAEIPKEITFTANITVSTKTAKQCLALLEIWQNDHPDKTIRRSMDESGLMRFRIEKVH